MSNKIMVDQMDWIRMGAENGQLGAEVERLKARTPGPDVSRLLEACRVALGALMNGSTDTQRHAAFHHLRGALKATEQEAAQPE